MTAVQTYTALGAWKKGDTIRIELVLEVEENGVSVPLNLANTTLASVALLVQAPNAPRVEQAFTIVDLNAAAGTFAVEADSSDWDLGDYLWDARISPAGGPSWSTATHILTLAEGIS